MPGSVSRSAAYRASTLPSVLYLLTPDRFLKVISCFIALLSIYLTGNLSLMRLDSFPEVDHKFLSHQELFVESQVLSAYVLADP